VFATFGTLQGGRLKLFKAMSAACRQAGATLVVAHGGKLSEAEAASIGATYVAAFLPYRAVLKHAALCITHGGSNTVLDALACGVPLLVRPVAFDQKGNLARVLHHGLGERLATRRLADQIGRLVRDPGYRSRAETLARELAMAGGRARAADIVEEAISD
jgi:zeaxanthin glucosyltransferase